MAYDLDLPGEDIDSILEVLKLGQFAMSHGMTHAEGAAVLASVLPIIERAIPLELLSQERRFVAAQDLLGRLRVRH